jgi:sulfatase modifying factor 1
MTATSATVGAGCTGAYETLQDINGNNLCVAKMVTITAGTSYQIDATEVTQGQYAMWLATNPPLPGKTDLNCGYVTNYGGYTDTDAGYAVTDAGYAGPDVEHHPVATVDWCDAYWYCKGVGKRLCGAIGGGSNPVDSRNDANASQWYRACSSGGIYAYPYGDTYQASCCHGYENGAGATTAVGALPDCVTSAPGYAGVYDLSGNVAEWEDSCTGTGPSAFCELRGGSMYTDGFVLACADGGTNIMRNSVNVIIGFRCCSA